MSTSNKYKHFEGLFAYCFKNVLIPEDTKQLLIVDCDKSCGALLNVTDSLFPKIIKEFIGAEVNSPVKELAAKCDKVDTDEAIFKELGGIKTALRNYLRSRRTRDEEVNLFGRTFMCSDICEASDECSMEVRKIVKDAAITAGTSVIILGINTALYSVEYAVRTEISPFMPTNIPNFINEPACVIDTEKAYAEGVDYINNNSKINTPLEHTITLSLTERGDEEGRPGVIILASEGTKYSDLADPVYTPFVFALASEPISLYSGGNVYKMHLPKSAFGMGKTVAVLQFAIGVKNDTPLLLIKDQVGNITEASLDKQIYGG